MDMRPVRQAVSRDEWQQRIQECRNSGRSVRVWCQEHDVSEGSYYYWLKQLRHEMLIESAPDRSLLPSFCEVSVGAEAGSVPAAAIVLYLPGLRLEVGPDVSQTGIQAAIRLLKSVC